MKISVNGRSWSDPITLDTYDESSERYSLLTNEFCTNIIVHVTNNGFQTEITFLPDLCIANFGDVELEFKIDYPKDGYPQVQTKFSCERYTLDESETSKPQALL